MSKKNLYVCIAYNIDMTEISISARIPEDVFKELEAFMKEESLEKSASIRKLLAEGLKHWKEQKALNSLEEGKVSFLKAAEMAGLSVWEFADLVQEKGIVWIKSERFIRRDIKKALQ
jgi:predicted HTH domain antitoxin